MSRSKLFLFIAPWAVLGFIGSVHAQNQLGDGRGLDNSLQAGSGGVNQSQQRSPAYLNANDVVTGNVSGLGFFRDDVGYGATNEFGDRLGGDHLFRAQARSLPAGMSFGTSSVQRVYRPASSLGVGAAQNRSYANIYTAPSTRGVQYGGVVIGAGPVVDITQSSLVRPLGSASAVPGIDGVGSGSSQTLTGQSGQAISASPLLGVRGYGAQSRFEDDGQDLQRQDAVREETDESSDASDDQNIRPYRLDYSVRSRAPSLELGRQIQTKLEYQQAGGPRRLGLDEIEAALFDALESNVATPGQDVYLDLLRKIQEAGQNPATGQTGLNATGQPTNRLVPEIDKQTSEQPSTTFGPDVTATVDSDDGATVEDSAAAAIDRARQADAARRAARGLEQRADQNSETPTEQQQPGELDRFQELLATLDYDLPRVSTLAGDREDKVNDMLRLAEADLSSGRYFKAEDRYQQVARMAPHYPLGRVGLVHAQLGAAMFHTASLTLRALLEQHPELIATRYELALLPPKERLAWVKQELEGLLDISVQVDTAVLLAYLGYQIDDSDLVHHGLDLASQQNPDDGLIRLLQRIWLHKEGVTEESFGK